MRVFKIKEHLGVKHSYVTQEELLILFISSYFEGNLWGIAITEQSRDLSEEVQADTTKNNRMCAISYKMC